MGLQIVKSSLASRAARRLITGGVSRVVSLFPNIDDEDGGDGGIISRVFNPLSRVVGFLWGALSWFSIRITDIFSWLISGVTKITSFDWNASDQQLRALQESQNTALASIWGGVVGEGVGWLAGIGVGYGVGMICPVLGGANLARYISTRVIDEAVSSISVSLRNAILQSVSTLGNSLLLSAYMQYRRLLKAVPVNVLSAVYGEDTAAFIKNLWGNEGGPEMSFSQFVEDTVAEIDSNALRAFVSSLLSEGWDTFVEAGFIIAYELDSALSQTRFSQNEILGRERAVLLQPDVRGDEKIFVAAKEELAIQTIESALHTFTFINNRDVGQLVGQPVDDYLRAQPHRRKANIVFRNYPRPPWTTRENRLKEVSYAIPDLRAGITWNELKNAAQPYRWGPYRATANLINGRQMAVYGASVSEAEAALMRLFSLSTTEIVTLNVSEERIRHPGLKKQETLVYPAFAHLLVRSPISTDGDIKVLSGQEYVERRARIAIWSDHEPSNFSELF